MRRLAPLSAVVFSLVLVLAAVVSRPRGAEGSAAVLLLAAHDPCGNCHSMHTAPGQTLTNDAVVEDLCLTCHGPAGPSPKKAEVHQHKTGSTYDFAMTCTACHNPHNHPTNWLGGTNLRLVGDERSAKITTPNSGVRDVVFESRGADSGGAALHSYADADQDANGVYDGVCEVCHTLTGVHQNSSAGYHRHQRGNSCLTCHPHVGQGGNVGAFLVDPTLECADCHNRPLDPRRAVISEFARRSHHVQGPVASADCRACHIQTRHSKGTVRLANADDPTNETLVVELTGDPVAAPADAAKLTPFCLACHDANAANGAPPFSDGVTPPNIDAGWAEASHKTVGYSCFGDGASGCHATAHGSDKQNLLAPHGVSPTPPANAEEEEGFCYTCHDGAPASTNIQGEFQKGANTAVRTFHHQVRDTEQSGGRVVECTSCHNPHQATNANKVRGVRGTDLRGNPVGPGTGNPRDALEYEVCLNCHGDTYLANRDINADGFNDTSNKRRDFNDSASAYHAVQQAGRNRSGAIQAALVGGLDTLSVIKCSDCHNNEQTRNALGRASNSAASPKGPHGSILYPILRDTSDLRAIQPAGQARSGQFRLCFLCHDKDKLKGEKDGNVGRDFAAGARTNFYGGSKDNLHWFHLSDFAGATCRSCHYNTHGNQSASNTIYRIIDGGPPTDYATGPPIGYKTRMVNFSPSVQARTGFTKPVFRIDVGTRNRGCLLVCHGTDHDGTGDFTYNPQARHGQPGMDNDPLKYTP